MQLRNGVYSYGLNWHADEPLGVHVLETDGATILFGAGMDDTADQIVDIADTHEIDVVIAEHGDPDHYGGIPALRDAVANLTVAVPAGDASFLEDAGIAVDRPLEPEETVWGVRTIAVPGHTPDNMAYLYEDVLVAGDTIAGADSAYAAEDNWSGPFAVITPDFNADDARTRESVERLATYDFETVLLTHGNNVERDGDAAVEQLIADLD